MERRVPRTVLVAAGLTVLALAGIHAGRERIAERWHIWRLRSSDEATRLDAAEKLAAMKSVAAVPELIRIIAEEGRERVSYRIGGGGTVYAYGPRGCTAIPSQAPQRTEVLLTPLAHAVFSIGLGACPALSAAIDADRDPGVKTFDLASTLTQILIAIGNEKRKVQKVAYDGSWPR